MKMTITKSYKLTIDKLEIASKKIKKKKINEAQNYEKQHQN